MVYTLEISRYKERGYETPRMKIMITARLSVRSQRKGTLCNEGNTADKTWGIVSPTIIQNATMPPNALGKELHKYHIVVAKTSG